MAVQDALARVQAADFRTCIVWRSDRFPEGVTVGTVETEIINGQVVVTISRFDEAKFGPVAVVSP